MYYELTAQQMTKVLLNLKGILNKAEAFAKTKNIQPDVFLQSRLAVDQFPLLRQIQIACDTAKMGTARLTGKTAPVHDDKETTWTQVLERIESTVVYLNSIKASDFDAAAEKQVSNQWWNGKTLTGKNYLIHHLIPNFYFHVTTAYSILRHNGVSIGKSDYLGELPFSS